jgi:hypothetical protein
MINRSYTMSPYPQCQSYPDKRRQTPLEGTYLPCCSSRTDGRSTFQQVGSVVTNVSLLNVVSKAPGVVG